MVEQKPTYVSRVRIVRERGPIRQATLPSEAQPVIFGTHDEVREHYGTAMGQYPDHATTLDYVVAAAAGWLCGTLGGALEARGIDASEGRLIAEGRGEIYVEDKVLVIKRIHVHYTLRGCPNDKRDAAERAHLHHASRCPVAKSIGKAIEIVTDLAFDWVGESPVNRRRPAVALDFLADIDRVRSWRPPATRIGTRAHRGYGPTGPTWYVALQGAIGVIQFLIALAMLRGYRRGGTWGAF